MALLRRRFHFHAAGPAGNSEDTWSLAFDTDTKQLYVEHSWDHDDGQPNRGSARLEVHEYLSQGGQTAGHRELWRILKALFDEGS